MMGDDSPTEEGRGRRDDAMAGRPESLAKIMAYASLFNLHSLPSPISSHSNHIHCQEEGYTTSKREVPGGESSLGCLLVVEE